MPLNRNSKEKSTPTLNFRCKMSSLHIKILDALSNEGRLSKVVVSIQCVHDT